MARGCADELLPEHPPHATRAHNEAQEVAPASRRLSGGRPAHRPSRPVSFAPPGLCALLLRSHGLRRGLHSFAAPRLGLPIPRNRRRFPIRLLLPGQRPTTNDQRLPRRLCTPTPTSSHLSGISSSHVAARHSQSW